MAWNPSAKRINRASMRLIAWLKRLYAITAGIAANSPIAVANSASAMPGATTARLVFCWLAIDVKLRMMPHTVPNSPTNGATDPTVASTLSRSDSWSISLATADPIVVPSRSRVPSRSMRLPWVERRHSVTPAASTRAVGRSAVPRVLTKASMSSARQNSCSKVSLALRVRPSFTQKAMMIAQVQMLASSSPSITPFTTQSA